ncbi:MAG: AEC family transporter [Ruminococcus sp.]
MVFFTTLTSVAMLLLYAIPGFLLVKTKLVDEKTIPAFAKVLLYVCQPALTLYSFNKAQYSPALLLNLGIFFLITLLAQLFLLMLFWFVLKKKRAKDDKYRIINIAAVLSNCGFFGIPIAEKLFPENSDVAAYCLMFTLSMNILCWTVVLAMVTGDKKYVRLKQVIVNPAVISFLAALLLFVFSVKLPAVLADGVSLVGRASTPLCMLILGMRLAATKVKTVFGSISSYIAVAVKQIAVPLFIFAALYFVPIDPFMKSLAFLLFSCPVASNVLNFAEMSSRGQDTAAGCVLLGTMLSIGTMPLMTLLL